MSATNVPRATLILLVAALAAAGCTSTSYKSLGVERGDVLSSEVTSRGKATVSYAIKQDLDTADNKLTVTVDEVTVTPVERQVAFATVEKRETVKRCRGWYDQHCEFAHGYFWVSHLLLVGFVVDPILAFNVVTFKDTDQVAGKPIQSTQADAEQSSRPASGRVTVSISTPAGWSLSKEVVLADGKGVIDLGTPADLSTALAPACGHECKLQTVARFGATTNAAEHSLEPYYVAWAARAQERQQRDAKAAVIAMLTKAKAKGATHVVSATIMGGGCREQLDKTVICGSAAICRIDAYIDFLREAPAGSSVIAMMAKQAGNGCEMRAAENFVLSGRCPNRLCLLDVDVMQPVRRGRDTTLTNGFGALIPAATWTGVGEAISQNAAGGGDQVAH